MNIIINDIIIIVKKKMKFKNQESKKRHNINPNKI